LLGPYDFTSDIDSKREQNQCGRDYCGPQAENGPKANFVADETVIEGIELEATG
jgi:hypothetical protein